METVVSAIAPFAESNLSLWEFPVYESELVPPGLIVAMDPSTGKMTAVLWKHPWQTLDRGYCPPFFTRHMLGVQEAERDKRRYSAH